MRSSRCCASLGGVSFSSQLFSIFPFHLLHQTTAGIYKNCHFLLLFSIMQTQSSPLQKPLPPPPSSPSVSFLPSFSQDSFVEGPTSVLPLRSFSAQGQERKKIKSARPQPLKLLSTTSSLSQETKALASSPKKKSSPPLPPKSSLRSYKSIQSFSNPDLPNLSKPQPPTPTQLSVSSSSPSPPPLKHARNQSLDFAHPFAFASARPVQKVDWGQAMKASFKPSTPVLSPTRLHHRTPPSPTTPRQIVHGSRTPSPTTPRQIRSTNTTPIPSRGPPPSIPLPPLPKVAQPETPKVMIYSPSYDSQGLGLELGPEKKVQFRDSTLEYSADIPVGSQSSYDKESTEEEGSTFESSELHSRDSRDLIKYNGTSSADSFIDSYLLERMSSSSTSGSTSTSTSTSRGEKLGRAMLAQFEAFSSDSETSSSMNQSSERSLKSSTRGAKLGKSFHSRSCSSGQVSSTSSNEFKTCFEPHQRHSEDGEANHQLDRYRLSRADAWFGTGLEKNVGLFDPTRREVSIIPESPETPVKQRSQFLSYRTILGRTSSSSVLGTFHYRRRSSGSSGGGNVGVLSSMEEKEKREREGELFEILKAPRVLDRNQKVIQQANNTFSSLAYVSLQLFDTASSTPSNLLLTSLRTTAL